MWLGSCKTSMIEDLNKYDLKKTQFKMKIIRYVFK